MPRYDKNKIIFDQEDFLAGLSFQGGSQGNISKVGKGFNFSQNITNTRYLGFLSPSESPTTLTNANVITTSIAGIITKDQAYDYAITSTSSTIHKIQYNSATPSVINAGDFPHVINHSHTGETGSDLLVYKHNVGGTLTTSLFYSFRDDTDWDVGCYNNFTTFDDDFLSTVPANPLSGTELTYGKDYPHPMIIGADGNLYIGSGRYLHCFEGTNGTNGTFVKNVLTLPSNFVITCFEKQGELLLIGGFYTASTAFGYDGGKASIMVYNYLDQVITQEIPIDDWYISNLFIWNGQVAGITYGEKGIRGNFRVRILSGTNFVPVAELNGSIQPITRGGIDFIGQQLLVNCAPVFSVGMPYNSSNYEVLTPYSTAVSGCIINHGTSYGLFISSATAPEKYLSGFNTAYFESNTAYPMMSGYYKARINGIVVIFRGTFTGGRGFIGEVSTDDGLQVFCSETTLSGDRVKMYLKDTSGVPFYDFTKLSINLTWDASGGSTSAAIVDRIEVLIEPITI